MPDTTTTASSPSASKADGNASADEIPLPLFVSAEAAVKSTRKDYVSLFDPKADLDNLKTCRSDPALMKQAVKRLKEVGFKVTSIGRFSVRIQGPPKLYTEQFGAKLTMVALSAESPGDTPTNFAVFASASDDPAGSPTLSIPIPKTSTLADSVASVFLDPPAGATADTRIGSGSRSTDQMENDGKKRNEMLNIAYLDELSALLGGGDLRLPTGRGVEVAVIDDDVHLRHSIFNAVPNILDIRTKNESAQTILTHDSHGTQVVGALLAVAGGVGLRFIQTNARPILDEKIPINHVTACRTAFSSLNETSHIVNCSWGEFALQARPKGEVEADDTYKTQFVAAKRTLIAYWKGCCETRPGQLFVWTAGNSTFRKKQGRPAQAYLSHLENIIVVGGAFPVGCTLDGNNKLQLPGDGLTQAVDGARGGMRYLPDGSLIDPDPADFGDPDAPSVSAPITPQQQTSANICGLLGPGLGSGGILLPSTRIQVPRKSDGSLDVRYDKDGKMIEELVDAWEVAPGTSFAAPQVAAVAAMVLERWPRASPADVKCILTETASPITHGQTIERLRLWDDSRGVFVGLVHIGRALTLAGFCAAVYAAKLNVSAKAMLKLVRDNSKNLGFKDESGDSKLVLNDPPQATLLELSLYGALDFLDKSIPN